MASFNVRDDYVMQKGPLSDQEQLLRELLVRDAYYRNPDFSLGEVVGPSAGGASAGASTGPTSTPPVVAQPGGGNVVITQLELVRPGDLITADFMNGVVRTLNQVVAYLRNQSVLSTANPQPAGSGQTPSAQTPPVQTANTGAAIAGLLKDVVITPAEAGDKVTVTFPAETVNNNDFSDLLIGSTRVDPGDLVKTDDGRLSFQVDKNAFTSGTDVRAVSKSGSSAQQVARLLK